MHGKVEMFVSLKEYPNRSSYDFCYEFFWKPCVILYGKNLTHQNTIYISVFALQQKTTIQFKFTWGDQYFLQISQINNASGISNSPNKNLTQDSPHEMLDETEDISAE